MIEIRIHGRGGQGAVTASELIAKAAFNDNLSSQCFPKFGPERTGAPVEAFCRIDKNYIDLRTQIYEPDYVIVLDPSLLDVIDVKKGLKKDGKIILNSKEKTNEQNTYTIDATKIATEIIGRPIVNTTMLGAFVKITKLITLESLEKAVRERFPPEIAEKNIQAIKKAYEGVDE